MGGDLNHSSSSPPVGHKVSQGGGVIIKKIFFFFEGAGGRELLTISHSISQDTHLPAPPSLIPTNSSEMRLKTGEGKSST